MVFLHLLVLFAFFFLSPFYFLRLSTSNCCHGFHECTLNIHVLKFQSRAAPLGDDRILGISPGGRFLGHQQQVLKEDCETLGLPYLCFLAPEVRNFAPLCTPTMMCSLARSPKQRGHLIINCNPQNCEPKSTSSLCKLMHQVFCYTNGKLINCPVFGFSGYFFCLFISAIDLSSYFSFQSLCFLALEFLFFFFIIIIISLFVGILFSS